MASPSQEHSSVNGENGSSAMAHISACAYVTSASPADVEAPDHSSSHQAVQVQTNY